MLTSERGEPPRIVLSIKSKRPTTYSRQDSNAIRQVVCRKYQRQDGNESYSLARCNYDGRHCQDKQIECINQEQRHHQWP
jgi:hypothetical protein